MNNKQRITMIIGEAGSGKTYTFEHNIIELLTHDYVVYLFDANGAIYGDYKELIEAFKGVVIEPKGDILKEISVESKSNFYAYNLTNSVTQQSYNTSFCGYFFELLTLLQQQQTRRKINTIIFIEELCQYVDVFHTRYDIINKLLDLRNEYFDFMVSARSIHDFYFDDVKGKIDFVQLSRKDIVS